LSKEGQLLLPMLDLINQAEMAVDELINVAGRAAIEAVLIMSAQEVAGPKHPGRKGGNIYWYGNQKGLFGLSDRKLRVGRPRLRRNGKGSGKEVEIPAYEAMLLNSRLGVRILEILLQGVSTRSYQQILPHMAETVGVSKSAVSREFIEASEQTLKRLCERKLGDKDILVVYIDGLQFGSIQVIAAVGVDRGGYKHVLGLREGASENAVVATDLLMELVESGLDPKRRRLFVIDGSKALRKAVDSVFGSDNPVQRCRNHKIRNVLGYLADEQKDQVRSVMKSAFGLDASKGISKLKKLAQWLEREYPSAAASLLEGLEEMFTVNRLGLPKAFHRCLCTTNVIESPYSGVRRKTGRVTRRRDGSMVLRWVASALLTMEKRFRRIMGYQQLWMLESVLNRCADEEMIGKEAKVA
jgi:putative transposase